MKRTFLPMLLALAWLSSNGATVSAQSGRQQAPNRNSLFSQPSIEMAWQAAVAEKKPLLVMFTSEHCLYCRKMLSETYAHPAIRQMLSGSAETVLAQAEDYRALTKRLGIRGYPTTLLVSPEGRVLDLIEGFVEPKAFAKRVSPLLTKQATRIGDASASAGDFGSFGR